MARRAFYSFHYKPDCWRAAQVRNMGAIEGNAPVSDHDWESITRGGDAAIERWIAAQLDGKSCTVVLIGSATAGRKWINYEIKKTWNDGKGLVGIHVHNLKDSEQKQATKGTNPFAEFNVAGTPLSSIVRTYDPQGWTSADVYAQIKANLAAWVEEAVGIRNSYSPRSPA